MTISVEELKGLFGMTVSFACAIVTMIIEAGELYSILAGFGGLLAGLGTSYYYLQKALFIREVRRKSKLAKENQKNS